MNKRRIASLVLFLLGSTCLVLSLVLPHALFEIRPLMLIGGGFLLMASADQLGAFSRPGQVLAIRRTGPGNPMKKSEAARTEVELYDKFPIDYVIKSIDFLNNERIFFVGLTVPHLPRLWPSLLEATMRGCFIRILLPTPESLLRFLPESSFGGLEAIHIARMVEADIHRLKLWMGGGDGSMEIRMYDWLPTLMALTLGPNILTAPYLFSRPDLENMPILEVGFSSRFYKDIHEDMEYLWTRAAMPGKIQLTQAKIEAVES